MTFARKSLQYSDRSGSFRSFPIPEPYGVWPFNNDARKRESAFYFHSPSLKVTVHPVLAYSSPDSIF